MYAILVPPLLLGVLVTLMSIESNYTFWTRIIFFGLRSLGPPPGVL